MGTPCCLSASSTRFITVAIDSASFTVERFLICCALRALVSAPAVPTADVVSLLRLVCHLVLDKIKSLLQVWSGVLDEEELLHFLCHAGQQFEIVLLRFCHCRQSTILCSLAVLVEPCLKFRECFSLESVSSCFHLQDEDIIFAIVSLFQVF